MELNETVFVSNETIAQVINYFNISITNLTNSSQETQIKLFDLYEAYRTHEREQLVVYKFVAYIVGTLIILSNLTVVISSGLILKKGQQPKSTYLLLGNVSLADTIIGISIIFGAIVDNSMSSNPLCIFQIGMLVCPAMVSIFSVGLIAVDRYIYILHGLYYQRWFNTTKVRIGIVCIWMIGITLSFLPATGYKNKELLFKRCSYVSLFPGPIILLNTILSVAVILIVAILYLRILVKALRNVTKINGEKAQTSKSQPKLRLFKGNNNLKKVTSAPSSIKNSTKTTEAFHRSSSFDSKCAERNEHRDFSAMKSKSVSDLVDENTNNSKVAYDNSNAASGQSQYDSKFSVCTLESSCSDANASSSEVNDSRPKTRKKIQKKQPNKWRAIIVVLLTSGSFILFWLPFFIQVIFYVFCEDKRTNPTCLRQHRVMRALATVALSNSILNPLIYAWWHKGFQRAVKTYFRKYCLKHFRKNLQ